MTFYTKMIEWWQACELREPNPVGMLLYEVWNRNIAPDTIETWIKLSRHARVAFALNAL